MATLGWRGAARPAEPRQPIFPLPGGRALPPAPILVRYRDVESGSIALAALGGNRVTRRLTRSRSDDDDPVSMGLRLKQLEEELREVQSSICRGLNQLLDLKDLNTGTHSTRIGETAVRVAVALGMDEDEQRNVEIACTLHDIGKIGVPDRILRKSGRLAEEEWVEMRRHPEYGWAILRLFPGLEEVSLFVLHHHERWDGSGYPGGLEAEQIPQGARVVAIVDAWDAMVSSRAYKPGLERAEALRRLRQDAGTHFDPDIAEAFCRMIEEETRASGSLPSLAGPASGPTSSQP